MGHRLPYRTVFYFFSSKSAFVQKREPYRYNLNTVFRFYFLNPHRNKNVSILNFYREPHRTEIRSVYRFINEKTEKWMIFGSVRFALFVKNLKTVRFAV